MDGIEKLPKWAQAEVRRIEGERDTAVRKLNEWEDDQTEAPFRFEDHVCDGENRPGPSFRTKYVQAHRMTVVFRSIEMDVNLLAEGIEIHYNDAARMTGRVALIPRSHQHILLESPEGDT